jgi:hypothetical protein
MQRQGELYRDGEDRPLGGYLALMGIYSAATMLGTLLARRLGRPAPKRISPWDVTQLILTTHKLSRLIAKDPVTSPVRAPFTTYKGVSAPGELTEEVRGHGFQHAAGELITCPMCLGQWVATALCFGLVTAPRSTRLTMATFSAVAGADFLQHAYVALQQATEQD